MSANQINGIQQNIQQLFQKAQELSQKIDNQQQTITYLWITIGILTVISFCALGMALWRNRK